MVGAISDNQIIGQKRDDKGVVLPGRSDDKAMSWISLVAFQHGHGIDFLPQI